MEEVPGSSPGSPIKEIKMKTEDNFDIFKGLEIFYIDFLRKMHSNKAELKLIRSKVKEITEDDDIIMTFEDGRCIWSDVGFPMIFAKKENAEQCLTKTHAKNIICPLCNGTIGCEP